MNEISMKADIEKTVAVVSELNPSAQLLSQAQQILRNPEAEVTDLEAVLKSDAAISSDIIRMSNSVLFSFPEPSRDLSTSIKRLGFNEIRRMLGIAISKQVFAKDLEYYKITVDQFWSESVSSALLMEGLGKTLQLNPQECYLVGLMSPVGKMVINEALKPLGEEAAYDGSEDLSDWERRVAGVSHAYAGFKLLTVWDFPEDIATAVGEQYHRSKAVTDSPFAAALMLTRKLAHRVDAEGDEAAIQSDPSLQSLLEEMDLPLETVEACLGSARETMKVIRKELFG
jgi:HD-like signal output (HDOD) protein